MISTEKEATDKACCDGGYGSIIRADDESKYDCIASKCMAWRWDEDIHHRVESKSLEEVTASGCEECATAFSGVWHLDGDRYRCPKCRSAAVKIFEEPERRRGYCGLAGRVVVR